MVYAIQLGSRIRTKLPDPSPKLSAKLYYIYHFCVQWKITDDGLSYFLKHVEFCPKNKFEKLVHLFHFIIRNGEDCSPKCKGPLNPNVPK